MPGKSKEDTWGAKELSESIKEARSSGKSRHKDKDRDKHRDREKDRDKDRHREKDRDKDKHREKDGDRDREKDRNKSRDKDRDHEKSRDKDREKDKDRHKDKDREKERERRRDRSREKDKEGEKDKHKDRDKDRERRHDKEERRKNKEGDDGRERSNRDKKDKHDNRDSSDRRKEKDKERRDEEKDRDKRDRSKDRERRHKEKDRERRDRDKDHGSKERDREKRRDKEEGDKEKRREERHRRREEGEGKEERRDRERKKEKEGTDSDRERRKHRDKKDEQRSDDRKKREKSDERRHRSKDGSRESSRERRHRKEKEEEREKRKKEEKVNGRDERMEREERKEHRKQEKTRRERDEDTQEAVGEEIHVDEAPAVDTEFSGAQQEDNYDDYEDDFEDYDDDFEDDDGDDDSNAETSHIDELRRAMAAENQAVRRSADSDRGSRSRSERSSASNTRPTTSRTGRTFINFVAAKQRQISDQVSQRTRKRGQELMNLIDLDVAAYDLFDMPPVKEYDRYISSFGRSNTKQAFVQCNDDNLDRDAQTEDIDWREKWTQFPAEGASACGGGDGKDDEDLELAIEKEINSLRFNRFLDKAAQLLTVILDEDLANRVGGQLESNQRNILFSDGYTLMNTGTPILQGRCITRVIFHPVQTNLILTLHSMPNKKVMEKAGLTNRGLMCVWNVNEPSRPQKILVLKSMPTCCSFSPSRATMAFAGTVDGSICVWDLREPSSMHQKCEFGWGHMIVRVPTYSTEGATPDESHHSQVVAMQPIVSADDATKAMSKSSASEDSTGLSFQLATIEEKGIISFWVVIEIDKPDEAGSESDLGLVPGGRIKLIKSSSIQLQVPTRELGPSGEMRICDMQLLPTNPNHFFVATDAGCVIHGARTTERVSPKAFWVSEGVPVEVRCIDFSPFDLPCFLVACKDGSIQLFSTSRGSPLVSWTNSTQGMKIVDLAWSRSRPSVFYVMDITSKVYVWELLENDGGPVKTEQFSRGRLTSMAVGNDHAATGWGMAGRKPEMVITDDMGSLDIHRLNKKFSQADASELDSFNSLLQQLI